MNHPQNKPSTAAAGCRGVARNTGGIFTRSKPAMANPLDELLSRMQGVKPNGSNQFMALCPAHDDKSPSLAITETEDGKVLVHCYAGCSTQEIMDSIGLELKDLFPETTLTLKQRQDYKKQLSRRNGEDALSTLMVTLLQVINDRATSRKLANDQKYRKRHPELRPYPQEPWDRETRISKNIIKLLEYLYG